MATIHIEPVPPGCKAAVVLAFVCEIARLDGKRVGKIAFVGHGVSVEVPDDKAVSAVAALDGAALNGRPVRARVAGKGDFTDADHFGLLSRLLDLEAEAEQDEARRRAQAEEGSPVGDGTTLTRLALRDSEFGLGGRLLLTFGRKAGNEPLPPTRLGPGSPVVLSQTNVNRRVPSYRGVVHDRGDATLGIAIDPPDGDLPDDGVWRLDLTPDEVSRLRQQDALRRAADAGGDRLATLREVLLGDRKPAVGPAPELGPPCSGLNGPQREAVALALGAKDVAIIHGPPGTGKTTTVVALIGETVARGGVVLVCAPSNHAVDNVLEKLLAAGESPVRLGHPARVSPELRDRTIDALADAHPDARLARKARRDAFAVFRQADKWTRDKPHPGEKAALRREGRALLDEARRLETLAVDKILDDAKVVCATLTGLDSRVLGQRRFDVAVIDEAGQSTEPSNWVPLLRSDKLVLAGDHCQLPPTILSREAARQGLAVSLMERLVGHCGEEASRLLTVQHRMHAAIMGFSNDEFYDGALIAHESVAGHRLCDLPGVTACPLTESPITFLDTAGASYDEALEEDTGSRKNPQEAALTAKKVRALVAAGVTPSRIGVIAPYRAQVRLLRDRLADLPGLEVDSVDGFQGREKEAIVVSMVRSNPEGEVGFLADTRRTNVALTRARRTLLVIGDSATLANESFYERMLTHLESIGAVSSVWEEMD